MNSKIQTTESRKSITTYIVGFVLSIVATLSAYTLVYLHVHSEHEFLSHEIIIPSISAIAIFQLIIQMVFFLHLNGRGKSRWNLVIFLSTFSIVLLVVVGSIWIMNHLNYNMTPQQIMNYTQDQSGM